MDPNTQRLSMGASGSAGGAVGGGNYVEDVFSTYLYTGNDSTQTITNGIDLAGEGGLVWLKNRNFAGGQDHFLHNSARGFNKGLRSNTTDAEFTDADQVVASSTGFTVGSSANVSPYTYASWTFRKAPKFFDVVTGTGAGTFNHSLGSLPGCIIFRNTAITDDWLVFHRGLSGGINGGSALKLNSNAAPIAPPIDMNATATTFSTSSVASGTWVAYVFAHDAGGFGDAGTDSVVSCGTFSRTFGTANSVNLGYEPQWVLIKCTTQTDSWQLYDTMRGLSQAASLKLEPNSSNSEQDTAGMIPTATGFDITATGVGGGTFIYIAIRRGLMKTPTDATKVFDLDAYTTNNSVSQVISVGFPADMVLARERTTANLSSQWPLGTRLLGNGFLRTTLPNTLATFLDMVNGWDDQNSIDLASMMVGNGTVAEILYSFRRAPGFFDVVAYTGTGANRTVSHDLGVAPELMIVKNKSLARDWAVGTALNSTLRFMRLNTTQESQTGSITFDTLPTSSVFGLGISALTNETSQTFIAYLFASCPGVSKVGSYTGTGTTLNIDCGFTAGARFVMIKRTDSTGDWYVWDTARGIVSGNDPFLLINSNAVEDTSTDYIDPLNTGFQISSSAPAAINANGGSFIYLAIA